MRYVLPAMLILLLTGCADTYYPGYAYSGYPSYRYGEYPAYGAYPGYGAYPAYAAPAYRPPPSAAYSSDNCGTPYEWKACYR